MGGGLNSNNGEWWHFDFEAPAGDVLAKGATFDATRYPFNNDGGGMDISGEGRGCSTLHGTFSVEDIAFTPDDTLKYVSITFEQFCGASTSALRGQLDYRLPIGDRTPPAKVSDVVMHRSLKTVTVTWTNPPGDTGTRLCAT